MSDLRSKFDEDRRTIDIHKAHEVKAWASSFGVSEEALRAAIAAVGPAAQVVRGHFRRVTMSVTKAPGHSNPSPIPDQPRG